MKRGVMKNIDLIVTILLALLYFPTLEETVARLVVGLALVLFLPGYSLVSALFLEDLDGLEKVAISLVLNIAIVALVGFALNYTPFGIALEPISILLSTLTISFSVIAWIRRIDFTEKRRFCDPLDWLKAKELFGPTIIDKILGIFLIVSIVSSSAMLVCVFLIPKESERFTEFYILSSNRKASDYPTNLKVGEEGEVIIGIVNHEYDNLTYRLEVNFNGNIIHKEYLLLVDNQTWEAPFTFVVTSTEEDQKLEFILYKGEDKEPYRKLHLWVDIEA